MKEIFHLRDFWIDIKIDVKMTEHEYLNTRAVQLDHIASIWYIHLAVEVDFRNFIGFRIPNYNSYSNNVMLNKISSKIEPNNSPKIANQTHLFNIINFSYIWKLTNFWKKKLYPNCKLRIKL